MTLAKILRDEQPILAMLSLDATQRAASNYRMWDGDGRKNDTFLQLFFENFFRSQELQDRITWIDEILEKAGE